MTVTEQDAQNSSPSMAVPTEIPLDELLIQAVYENGVLRPEQPLPLAEHERVQVSIHPAPEKRAALEVVDDPVRATYGILEWKGDAETAERLALDAEFGVDESP